MRQSRRALKRKRRVSVRLWRRRHRPRRALGGRASAAHPAAALTAVRLTCRSDRFDTGLASVAISPGSVLAVACV